MIYELIISRCHELCMVISNNWYYNVNIIILIFSGSLIRKLLASYQLINEFIPPHLLTYEQVVGKCTSYAVHV